MSRKKKIRTKEEIKKSKYQLLYEISKRNTKKCTKKLTEKEKNCLVKFWNNWSRKQYQLPLAKDIAYYRLYREGKDSAINTTLSTSTTTKPKELEQKNFKAPLVQSTKKTTGC